MISINWYFFTILTSWIVTWGTTIRGWICVITTGACCVCAIGRYVTTCELFRLGRRSISWGVKIVWGILSGLELIFILFKDIDGGLNSLDSLVSVLESSVIRADSFFELSLSVRKELSVEIDLLLEGVFLVLVGSKSNLIIAFFGLSVSEILLLLTSDGGNFSNQSLVVLERLFFTVSVISIWSLDSILDLGKLLNDVLEFLSIKLSRELDESLDGVASGDSLKCAGNILLGDLKEGVSSRLEIV